MNIQDLKSNTTWQEASNTINNNNNKISLAIATLENATLKNKGYFTTLEKLNAAIPNPTIGSKAYVGTSEPYAIYIVENGSWVDSGYTGGDEIVANITTDRIENGAVTTEKIATSAFDSTLSVSGKIAPADVVGRKLTDLEDKVGIAKTINLYVPSGKNEPSSDGWSVCELSAGTYKMEFGNYVGSSPTQIHIYGCRTAGGGASELFLSTAPSFSAEVIIPNDIIRVYMYVRRADNTTEATASVSFLSVDCITSKISNLDVEIKTINEEVTEIKEYADKFIPKKTVVELIVPANMNEPPSGGRTACELKANTEYKIDIDNYTGATPELIVIYGAKTQSGSAFELFRNNTAPFSRTYTPSDDIKFLYAYIRRTDKTTEASINVTITEPVLSNIYKCTPQSGFYNALKKIAEDGLDAPILYVGEGEYDLYQELGGTSFANTITSGAWGDWNIFTPKDITIIGVGNVVLKMDIPHNDLVSGSKAEEFLSPLNTRLSCNIQNIVIDAGNCRYGWHLEGGELAHPEANDQIYKLTNCRIYRNTVSYGKDAAIGIGINKGGALVVDDCVLVSTQGRAFGGHLNNGGANMTFSNTAIKGGQSFKDWALSTQWNSEKSCVNFYNCVCPRVHTEGNPSKFASPFYFTFVKTDAAITRTDNIGESVVDAYGCVVTQS